MTMLVREEGEVTLGTLVRVVALVPALVAGDLLQGRGHLDEAGTVRLTVVIGLHVIGTLDVAGVSRVAARVSAGVIHCVDIVAMLQAAHILLARVGLVAQLAAIVARGQFLVQLILTQFRQRGQLEVRMHVLAGRALGAEAG